MSDEAGLQKFFDSCRAAFLSDTPGMRYLESRGYTYQLASPLGLGFYRGATAQPIENRQLKGFLWAWGESKPAIVYPLRTLGGSLLGVQFGALAPGQYKDYFLPNATQRGVFFYPDNLDWERLYSSRAVCTVEGALDGCAMSLFISGVLSCLTAKPTPSQLRSLYRWFDMVYCGFDNDEAGIRGYDYMLRHKNGFRVIRVSPTVKDPQLLHEKGALKNWVKTWAPSSTLLRA